MSRKPRQMHERSSSSFAADLRSGPEAIHTRRHRTALAGWTAAAEVIGPITPDLSLFLITRGQISMIDLVRHFVADLTAAARGPLHASVWTWAIADYELDAFEWFFATRALSGATLVIDRGAEIRNGPLLERWRQTFGPESVRVCHNHAKIITVTDGTLRIAARGSSNLNQNPRLEQLDISVNDGAFELIQAEEQSIPVLPPTATPQQYADATGIGAYGGEQMRMFAGIRTWAK